MKYIPGTLALLAAAGIFFTVWAMFGDIEWAVFMTVLTGFLVWLIDGANPNEQPWPATHYTRDDIVARQIREARQSAAASAEAEALREALADPNAVHVSLLRGDIARPSVSQIIHIYGREAILTELMLRGNDTALFRTAPGASDD